MPTLPARVLVVAATCLALTGGFAGLAATDVIDLTGAETGAGTGAAPSEQPDPSIPAATSADPLTVAPEPSSTPTPRAVASARSTRAGTPKAGRTIAPGPRRPAQSRAAAPTLLQQSAFAVPEPARPSRPRAAKRVKQRVAQVVTAPPAASFVISSFNVLGSSHTSGRDRRAPGRVRIQRAATLLRMHAVDIAGLQELQADQHRELMRVAGHTYDVYPGTAAGPRGVENSIIWRTSQWRLQAAMTVQIPYFGGRLRPMPYILLRHTDSGRMVWVANFHNPATNPKRGNNDRHRARAASIETSLAARLWNESGYPVFVLGDMNDRESYFCTMTAGAPMKAANGGSNDGGCRPPPAPMPVDWIFGSDVVTFSRYARDLGPLVRSTTDHPMVRATVLLDQMDGVAPSD